MKQFNPFKLLFVLAIVSIGSFSCDSESDENLTQEEELQNLQELFQDIETMADSVSCEDASEWTYTAFGSKPCGGPMGFIAYSTTIDTLEFLRLIEQHRQLQDKYNNKWDVASDCSVPSQPDSIICNNGIPAFLY